MRSYYCQIHDVNIHSLKPIYSHCCLSWTEMKINNFGCTVNMLFYILSWIVQIVQNDALALRFLICTRKGFAHTEANIRFIIVSNENLFVRYFEVMN